MGANVGTNEAKKRVGTSVGAFRQRDRRRHANGIGSLYLIEINRTCKNQFGGVNICYRHRFDTGT